MIIAGIGGGAAGGCSSANDNPPPTEEPDAGEVTPGKPDATPAPACATPTEKREKVEVTCDGVDNDCDGTVDNVANPTPWYRDEDNDGVGVAEAPRFSCNQPVGYVNTSGDCDDKEPRVHPGINVKDVCDGLDNDCNKNTLESCPTGCVIKAPASDATHLYLFCKDSQAWQDAKSLCEREGYALVKIGDPAENTFVRETATAAGDAENWLIGATDGTADDKEDKWIWTDGTAFWNGRGRDAGGTAVAGTYNNWPGNKEPNNDGNEDCGEIVKDGTWNDNKCTNKRPYVCERY